MPDRRALVPAPRSTCRIRLAFQRHDGVGRISALMASIGAALAQFERPRRRVGHDGETHPRQAWPRAPVVVVALEDDFLILFRADKLEWPRVPIGWRVISSSDPSGTIPLAPSERFHSKVALRLLQMKDNGEIVGRVDAIDEAVRGADFVLRSLPSSRESNVHFTSREVSGRPS